MENTEKLKKKKKKYFSTLDLIYIALFAGIGIGIKPVTMSISGFLKTLIPFPGGSLMGIVYSFIIFTGAGLVKKPGAVSFIGIIQAILVNLIGFGSHGGLSLITYTVPCFFADGISYLAGKLKTKLSYILGGGAFNMLGTIMMIVLFQRVTVTPTVILIGGGLSFVMGAIGGFLASRTVKLLEKLL